MIFSYIQQHYFDNDLKKNQKERMPPIYARLFGLELGQLELGHGGLGLGELKVRGVELGGLD